LTGGSRLSATASNVVIVTAGTDWPAIVAATATGIVGIAGIAGTVWQGKRAGDAEKERANHTERLRVYASFLIAVGDIAAAFVFLRSAYQKTDDSIREKGYAEYAEKRGALYQSLAEVRLIGVRDVESLANDLTDAFVGYASAVMKGQAFESENAINLAKIRQRLTGVMRSDLEGKPRKRRSLVSRFR
jgi:hypothetical protein